MRACNFFALWLRMLISYLNDVGIGCSLEFKNGFGKYDQASSKNRSMYFFMRHTVFTLTLTRSNVFAWLSSLVI